MRGTLRRLTVSTAAITAFTLTTAPAWADDGVNWRGDGSKGTVTVEVEDPGSGGGKSSGGGGTSSGGGKSSGGGSSSGGSKASGGGGTTSVSNGGRTSVGNYDSGSPASVSIPAWEQSGASDADRAEALAAGVDAFTDQSGTDWSNLADGRTTTNADGWNQAMQVDVPGTPAAPAADEPAPEAEPEPQVDPAELAQTAVSQMGLEAPEIASTPNDTETLGAVGLPVWLWVANPGETTTGPNTTSASAGAVTVTATAKFTGMSIDMGDGTTIECDGPGTEYPGTGIDPSPDCGHVYDKMSDEQPDGLYTVNITAHWGVEWESNTGETGTIPIELTTSKQLRIGQYQTVVTDVS